MGKRRSGRGRPLTIRQSERIGVWLRVHDFVRQGYSLRNAFAAVEVESGRNAKTIESDFWAIKVQLAAQGIEGLRNGEGIAWFRGEVRRLLDATKDF